MGREDTIQFLRGTEADLAAENPLLKDAEPCKETDTGKYKLGPGRWLDLDYYLPETAVRAAIDEAIAAIPPGGGGNDGSTMQALTAHIESLNPHEAWDNDGPSFAALYTNWKV